MNAFATALALLPAAFATICSAQSLPVATDPTLHVDPTQTLEPVEPIELPAAVRVAEMEMEKPPVNQLPEAIGELLRAAMRENDDAAVQAIARAAISTYPGARADLNDIIGLWNTETRTRGELLLALADAPVIVNVGRLRPVENMSINPRVWNGRGELGGFRSTGSTSEFGMSASLTVNYRIGRWQHVMRGTLDYRESNGKVSQENWLLGYEPRLQINPDLFVYGLSQYEHAPFIGFDERYTLSSGLGAIVFKDHGLNLRLTAGPAYRQVNYVLGEDESRLGARAAMDFDWKLSPTMRFTHTASSYVERGVLTFGMNSGITAQIAARLASRFSYNVQIENNGERGDLRYLRRLDTTSRVSLVYDF